MSSVDLDVRERPARRAAAKKASLQAAEQLKSSPIRATPAHVDLNFGEPSRPRMNVKVTYGKKSRSPAKNSPNRPPPISKNLSAPSLRSLPNSTARPRPRKAPTQAHKELQVLEEASSDDGSLTSLSEDFDDDLIETAPVSPLLVPKKTAYVVKAHAPRKKRRLSPLDSNMSSRSNTESILTPLSSPEPEEVAKKDNGSHASAREHMGQNNEPRPSVSSRRRPLKLSYSAPSIPTSSVVTTTDVTEGHFGDEDCEFAFVRLDISGEVSEKEESMWWPAKVTSSKPLRVRLFGRSPGNSITQAFSEITVLSPSSQVFVSCVSASGRLRFDEKSYSSGRRPHTLNMSPRKRQKTEQSDLDARWCEARDLLLEAYEEDNDGLPLLVSHYKSKDRPAGVRPRAVGVVIQGGSVSEPEETQAPWEPPGPNELYDLPGELVLAKEKPRSSEYWPAKLIEYIPPQKPTQKPKYKALFFDGIIKDIPKDMFYSIYDTEFKSCKMGAAADDYDLNENAEDEGADDFTMTFDDNVDEESLRAPSPDPKEPAPIAFAHDLTIPEQFEYSKPVLVALMNGEYPPATHLHVAFMKGGRWRNQVTSSAWKRGELSHKEKEELSDCIRRWMHKRMVRQKLGLVPPDTAVRMQDGDHVSPDEKQDTSAVGQVVLEKDDSVEPPPCTQSSAGDTEYAHSVAAGPPSSFIVSDILEETDGEVEILDSVDSVDKNVTKVVVTQPAANAAPVQMAVTNIPEHPPELSDTDQEPLLSRSLPTYAMLSGIDQITYCTSVLLPEAILQLLLWRNNLRRSPQLLSREEEEELHRQAEERASASYWVHDIVYMKRSAEGKTLPPYVSEPPDQATSSRGRRQLRRH